MIKAVVFDLDGVFFENGTKEFLDTLSEKFETERDHIAQVYLKSDQMQEYKKGNINGDEYWNWAISELGIDSSKDEIIEILMSSYSVKEETKEYVVQLRERGFKTAICTNNFPERLNGLKAKFKLDQYFDAIIASFEVGITKPSPEIFHKLAEELGCEPSEIIMSDDREENVEALKRLGFKAIGFESWEGFVEEVEGLIKHHQ